MGLLELCRVVEEIFIFAIAVVGGEHDGGVGGHSRLSNLQLLEGCLFLTF